MMSLHMCEALCCLNSSRLRESRLFSHPLPSHRGFPFMTSSLEGGRGPKKKQTTERNQLILVCDKGEGVKKSKNFADVINGVPLAKCALIHASFHDYQRGMRRGGRGRGGFMEREGATATAKVKDCPPSSPPPPLRSTLSEIKVNFLLLPRNGTKRNGQSPFNGGACRYFSK